MRRRCVAQEGATSTGKTVLMGETRNHREKKTFHSRLSLLSARHFHRERRKPLKRRAVCLNFSPAVPGHLPPEKQMNPRQVSPPASAFYASPVFSVSPDAPGDLCGVREKCAPTSSVARYRRRDTRARTQNAYNLTSHFASALLNETKRSGCIERRGKRTLVHRLDPGPICSIGGK